MMMENYLFYNDDEFFAKLLQIVELFYTDTMTILCDYFDDNNDDFAIELNKMFGENVKTLFTGKRLLSRKKYSKKEVQLTADELSKILFLAIKYCESPNITVSDNNGLVLFGIVPNDNDGTFIIFNMLVYDVDQIKSRTNQILNG